MAPTVHENGKPKMATKEELWSVAKNEFGVSLIIDRPGLGNGYP